MYRSMPPILTSVATRKRYPVASLCFCVGHFQSKEPINKKKYNPFSAAELTWKGHDEHAQAYNDIACSLPTIRSVFLISNVPIFYIGEYRSDFSRLFNLFALIENSALRLDKTERVKI